MGRGLDTALLQRAVACAVDLGMVGLSIESDPHAEPFYVQAGAIRIGDVGSTVFPGRRLPQRSLDLTQFPG